MNRSFLRVGMTCLSFGVVACEAEPELLEISSTSAALTATQNSERALQGVLDAADFLASSTSIAETLNALGGSSVDCAAEAPACSGDAVTCPTVETTCTTQTSEADLEETRQELREAAADWVRELRERILIEENLESETSTEAIYLLGPAVLCDRAPAVDTVTGGELDADCVEQVNRLQPRLRLTSPNEGDIDIALLLGEARRAPLTVQLYQSSLGLSADLGQIFALSRDLGEDLEGVESLAGVLQLQLVENQPRDYSLELNVLEALSLELSSDGDTLSASLGASSPAWHVRVDGNARSLSAGIDLALFKLVGPLRLFADSFEGGSATGAGSSAGLAAPPGDAFAPLPEPLPEPAPIEPAYTGIIDLFVAGLSGTATYTADSDVLELEDLGFGDSTSTLKHDGNTLFSLDFNQLQGRRVNLVIEPAGDGAKISVTPTFDLKMALAFHYVADQFDDLASYLLDDTLRVWFAGDAPAVEAADGQLRVVSGTLNLESSATPGENLSVTAGMCLVELEATAETTTVSEHPFSSFAASACE